MHIVQAVLSSPQLSHKCPQKKSTIRNAANEEAERKERKRQQNRIAQRTYRQNQKERIQILETAIARNNNAHHDLTSLGLETPMTSTMPALGLETPRTSTIAETTQPQLFQDPLLRRGSSSKSSVHNDHNIRSGDDSVPARCSATDVLLCIEQYRWTMVP
ncbi:unnamed protein product [Zymoseptoria tritici ST99CH_3D7]|uniref:BZIP domain-containing protein n=1 Tax=Zymoseptoria tritici (strain ST99CH_3D7) TaxID=1276538 RepID=A0A1X7RVU6_ZYMT9|nr:unnamed protein product [Zymoseptoria tritici ST99CH_3D7]